MPDLTTTTVKRAGYVNSYAETALGSLSIMYIVAVGYPQC